MSERPMAQEHRFETLEGDRVIARADGISPPYVHALDVNQSLGLSTYLHAAAAELLRVVAERNEALEGEQVALRQRDQFERDRDAALARVGELESDHDEPAVPAPRGEE